MGVPDEVDGPVRKRPKLALRTSRKSEPLETMSYSSDSMPYKSEDTFSSNISSKTTAPNEYVSVTPDLPSSSDPLVPPVASLYNLGNTCFMNSILEVLRYTPGFLEGMEKLNLEIDEESEEEPSNSVQLVWQVVKSTHQLYSDMESREKQYLKVATCDASSMAVKPTALLDKIRELNPMFEGHYQHDAQELLRCLLCFIEDAHKGLLAIKEKRKEKLDLKREENLGLKEEPPKCDEENQHSCLAPAILKTEPENGMVLKGGSTDSQSVSEAKTRAQSKKLTSGASRNLMDTYFGVNRTVPTSPAGISISANVSSPVKDSHTAACRVRSRKRKRSRSRPNSRSQASDHCVQIHPASMVEAESVHLTRESIKRSPCRMNHSGHNAAKKESHSSVSDAKATPIHDKTQPSIVSMFSDNPLRCSGSRSDPVEQSAGLTSDIIWIDKTDCNSPIIDLIHSDTENSEAVTGSDCVDSATVNSDIFIQEENVMASQNSDYKAPCPADSTLHSLSSIHDVDCVEDILDVQDVELANIDSTLDSVAKKYCSSQPESPSRPSAPSPVLFCPGPTELIVLSPDRQAMHDGGDCSNFFTAGKEAHVILHSPFKPDTSMCILGNDAEIEHPKSEDKNSCVKKLFLPLETEPPQRALSLFADSMTPPVGSVLKKRVFSSSLPASTTQLASTSQLTPPTSADKMEHVTLADSVPVKSNFPPKKELKMQLKKCDWLGVSPVKSVSARLATSALAKNNIPVFGKVKKEAFTDEITVNESLGHMTATQVASIRRSVRKKTACTRYVVETKKEHVSISPSVLLKPLSIQLDRCDWVLTPNHTVDAQKAMLKLQRSGGHKHPLKPERAHKSLLSHGEAIGERKNLMQYSGTLVEHLFGGTMMHRTKCLECELAKERQEVFMDVSVPIKSLQTSDMDSDDDDEGSKDSCLDKLMLAFSNIERLKENNKYFCEECTHYVEAERSCHYTTLPLVLTLHLKRFSSNKGLMGGVSKLNDKVIISQHLPCLHYMCKQNCKDLSHRYSLYGIVTHSGSLLSGHYRAYVKVQKKLNPAVFASLRRGNCRADPTLSSADFLSSSEPPQVPEGEKSFPQGKDLAPDRDYCRKSLGPVNVQESKHCSERERSSTPSSVWLECDDECIRVIEENDFLSRLEEGDGRAVLGTPYILFYHSLTLV